MIEHGRREKTDEDLEELLRRIVTRKAVEYPAEEKWNEKQYWPFWYSEFGEEKREVNHENQIGQIEFKGVLKEDIGECVETREDEENGKILKHVYDSLASSPLMIVVY